MFLKIEGSHFSKFGVDFDFGLNLKVNLLVMNFNVGGSIFWGRRGVFF